MTFVFLLILVGAITAIALVATGRISRPPQGLHDQRPTYLPDAPVTSESLDRVRFSMAFRGYRMDQVDALVSQMRTTLAAYEAADRGVDHANTGGNGDNAQGHAE